MEGGGVGGGKVEEYGNVNWLVLMLVIVNQIVKDIKVGFYFGVKSYLGLFMRKMDVLFGCCFDEL